MTEGRKWSEWMWMLGWQDDLVIYIKDVRIYIYICHSLDFGYWMFGKTLRERKKGRKEGLSYSTVQHYHADSLPEDVED